MARRSSKPNEPRIMCMCFDRWNFLLGNSVNINYDILAPIGGSSEHAWCKEKTPTSIYRYYRRRRNTLVRGRLIGRPHDSRLHSRRLRSFKVRGLLPTAIVYRTTKHITWHPNILHKLFSSCLPTSTPCRQQMLTGAPPPRRPMPLSSPSASSLSLLCSLRALDLNTSVCRRFRETQSTAVSEFQKPVIMA